MDCEQKQIVDELLKSYQEAGGINNIDGANYPSKRAVPGICEELLRILFPGFFEEHALCSNETEMVIAERMCGMLERLRVEVNRSLRSRADESVSKGETSDLAHKIVCDFLHELPEVRSILSTDVQAAYDGDPAAKSIEEIILSYPCIEAIAIQRLAHVLYNAKVPLLPRMMTEWAHEKTGIDIHPGAQIGSHFFIDHGTGVVIGETCVIGSRVKLYHGVTLGARSFPKDGEGHIVKGIKRHPDVEDDVTIYPNATVLGGDTVIGEGSTIGGNVFLMKSVPPHSLVALEDQEHRVLDKRAVRPGSPIVAVPATGS
ncbi:MAG: serine acetyltransferase [Verrucomicrobiae bacterium]|nr:serine acetyltransferase [Verrucomicrobiae bacterium]